MLTTKAVDARSNRALVSKVSGDPALVLGPSSADIGGVEDEPILWRISLRLQGSVNQGRGRGERKTISRPGNQYLTLVYREKGEGR